MRPSVPPSHCQRAFYIKGDASGLHSSRRRVTPDAEGAPSLRTALPVSRGGAPDAGVVRHDLARLQQDIAALFSVVAVAELHVAAEGILRLELRRIPGRPEVLAGRSLGRIHE